MHKLIAIATLLSALAAPASGKNQDKKTIVARDVHEAASMKLAEEDAWTEICVRQLELNSRTRYRKVCMNQAAWKSYVDSIDEMTSDWRRAGKGTTER